MQPALNEINCLQTLLSAVKILHALALMISDYDTSHSLKQRKQVILFVCI